MEASLNLGDSATYELKQALLLYEARTGVLSEARTAVSIHDVEIKEGRPILQAGQPITLSAVESLAAKLGRNLAACFLPANVISVSFGQVAWFCPAARRRIWFKADGRFNGGRTESEKELNDSQKSQKLNGKFAAHPPLLFMARDTGLYVFALPDNQRPHEETTVLRAPYWNLWEDGKLCQGNRHLSKQPTVANIPSFEDGFFNSAFSHTNIARVTRHPHGHSGLWQELCARQGRTTIKPSFWKKNLLPLKTTVTQLLTCKK